MLRRHNIYIRYLLVFVIAGFASITVAQANFGDDDGEQAYTTAEVRVDGYVLFSIRGFRSMPAYKRANQIERVIEDIASDENLVASDIKLVERRSIKTSIVHGRREIMSVTEVDASHEGTDDREATAAFFREAMVTSIERFRAERERDYLVRNLTVTGVATVVFIVLLYLLHKGFQWLDRRVMTLAERLQNIHFKTFPLIRSGHISYLASTASKLLKYVVYISLGLAYINRALVQLPWTRAFALDTYDLFATPVSYLYIEFIDYIPSLVFVVVIFFIFRGLLKVNFLFFKSVESGRVKLNQFDPDWAIPTYRLSRIIIIILGVMLAYPYLPGANSVAFKGLSVFLAVMVSVGSPAIMANIFAGYSLTYRRAFKVGDRIKINDVTGDVIEMRLMVTTLKTPKKEEVIIPNSTILNSNIVNYSSSVRTGGVILHTSVGIGYEVPWRQVEAILLEAATRTEGVLADPEPFVLQSKLADHGIDYQLNVYSMSATAMSRQYTELHRNIQDVFNEYGVQIMTPFYTSDTPNAKTVKKEDWYREPAKHVSDET